jgi:16S rRNA (cytidine1402-2'-O)-methyltransferase
MSEYYQSAPLRGEVVIVVEGAPIAAPSPDALEEKAREMREQGSNAREIVQRLVNEFGASRNVAYRLAHED